ncbi:MAG: acyltransferase 3 [Candidatus Solibacter sp.]|nr:acyltransferase 3 [Candidatus Solibacter sp.]
MVLMVHLVLYGVVPNHPRLMVYLRSLMWSGWSGVDLFFVLSGFLITGILLDSRSSTNYFKSFYMRRVLRIFPLYYFAVITTAIATPLLFTTHPFLRDFYPSKLGWLSYFFYYHNWWIPLKEHQARILGPLWSLGVEEQFYLLWPACVWLTPSRYLKWVCLSGISVALVARYAWAAPSGTAEIILTSTLTRLDTLLAGGFMAIAMRDKGPLSKVKKYSLPVFTVATVGIGLIAVVGHEAWSRGHYTQTIGFTLYAAAYACIVLWGALQNGTGSLLDRFLNVPVLRMFGKYSYGVYVYHGPILLYWRTRFIKQAWYGESLGISLLVCGFLISASLAVAMVSYKILENPFLRLKDRFEVRQASAKPGGQAAGL